MHVLCQEMGKLFFGEPPAPNSIALTQITLFPVPFKHPKCRNAAGERDVSVYQSASLTSSQEGPLSGSIIWQLSKGKSKATCSKCSDGAWNCLCVVSNHRTKKEQDVGFEEVGRTCSRIIGVQLAGTLEALLWP